MEENSPPSSKKSSAISKVDLVDTPHMSPYRTRSRKNSTLTEENIAMHNDSPTTRNATRRITRRMSQDLGSENANITTTPMPAQLAKRNRRSTSVVSEESGATTKPKFSLAQENVVFEEDEAVDESKVQSVTVVQNGSSHVNNVANSGMSEMEVDTNVTVDVTRLNTSGDFNKISWRASETDSENFVTADEGNLTITPVLETSVEADGKDESKKLTKVPSKISKEMVAAADKKVATIDAISLESESVISKSLSDRPVVADALSSAVSTEAKSTSKVETIVPAPLSTVVTNLPVNPVTIIKKAAIANVNVVTPLKPLSSVKSSVALNKSDVIIIPDTPTKPTPATLKTSSAPSKSITVKSLVEENAVVKPSEPKVTVNLMTPSTTLSSAKVVARTEADAVVIPDTPLKPTPATPVTSKTSSTPLKSITTKSLVEENAVVKPTEVKVTVIPETPGYSGRTTRSSSVNVAVTPTTTRMSSKSALRKNESEIFIPETSTPTSLLVTPPLDTPLQKSILTNDSMDVSISSPENPSNKTVLKAQGMDTSELDPATNQESPLKAAPSVKELFTDVSKTNQETPSKTTPAVADSIPNPETPSKTELGAQPMDTSELIQETPSKTVLGAQDMDTSELNQATNQQTPSVKELSIDVSETNLKTPSKTTPVVVAPSTDVSELNQEIALTTASPNLVQLNNGTSEADEEYPKFGGSVHRKSDGQPIDSFGINAQTEQTSLTVNPKRKSKSSFINDSSDDEDVEQNEFIDGEAVESNGESSMDEEERQYLKEHEIPDDGISLGSDTDVEELSDESNDSFVVSDSSVELLDGSGDDLEIVNEKCKIKISVRRGNKILDTSDEENLENLEPEKPVNSKSRSDTMPRTPVATKRASLQPNTKLKSGKLKVSMVIDSSEEDLEEELANLDAEPKNTINSKRLSDSMVRSKNDAKRMSLHPNVKLNSGGLKKELDIEIDETKLDESSVEDELANLDAEPKKTINSKRLSDSMSRSKKDIKRMSLHPNAKLNSGGLKEVLDKTTDNEKDEHKIDESSDEEMDAELANLDAEPKKGITSQRLSDSMSSRSKKDMKRMSLHPNAKLNGNGSEQLENQQKSSIDERDKSAEPSSTHLDNEIEKMDIEQSPAETVSTPHTSTGEQHQVAGYFDVDEIKAKCDLILNSANEAKRQDKLKNKVAVEEEKYQRLKEKKTKKLQKKKEKEARKLQSELLAAKQRQLKREKKLKTKEITEDEKAKAIEKALAFKEQLQSKKTKHSTTVKEEIPNETIAVNNATTTAVRRTNKKRKFLDILDNSSTSKKIRLSETPRVPARPEGFMIHSKPVMKEKIMKLRRVKRKAVSTTAGTFEVVAEKPLKRSPFTVTTLKYNAPLNFANFKEQAISNSHVQRESSAELLTRKKKQRNLEKH